VESRQARYKHVDLLANHHKWLPEWKRLLSQDPSLLFRIAEEAVEATDFLLRFLRPVAARHNPVPKGVTI
jgi:hypothetical protein